MTVATLDNKKTLSLSFATCAFLCIAIYNELLSFIPVGTISDIHWSLKTLFVVFGSFVSLRLLYQYFHVHKATIYCTQSELTNKILARCKTIHDNYRPTFWLTSPHLQMLFADTLKKTRYFPEDYRNYSLRLKDGGCVSLHWVDTSDQLDAPIVLVLHGLTGGSHSKYTTNFAHYMANVISKNRPDKPWRITIYERRGCGVNPILNQVPYTYTNVEDLRQVISHIKSRYPNAPLYCAGFSAGGNLLCKYLAEEGDKSEIRAGVTACGAFEFAVTSQPVPTYLNNFYMSTLYQLVAKKVWTKQKKFFMEHPVIDVAEVEKSKNFREFDKSFTCKVLGVDLEEYYESSACYKSLHNISKPIMFVNTVDDPILKLKNIPFEEPFESKKHKFAEWNVGLRCDYRTKIRENMILCISEKGGHHSFLEGIWPVHYSWLDKCLGEYLEAVHSLHESNEIK